MRDFTTDHIFRDIGSPIAYGHDSAICIFSVLIFFSLSAEILRVRHLVPILYEYTNIQILVYDIYPLYKIYINSDFCWLLVMNILVFV